MKKLSKKRVVSTLLLAVMVTPLTSVTNLQTVIKAQTQTEVTIKDKALENALKKAIADKKHQNVSSITKIYKEDLEMLDFSLELNDENIKSLEGVENCKNLKKLWFKNLNVTDFSKVKYLTNVKEIYFENLNKDADISAISNLTNLENITFENLKLKTYPNSLSNLTKLKEIIMRNTNFKNVSSLKNLTNLEKLTITGQGLSYPHNEKEEQLTDENIKDLSTLTGLTLLNLSHNQITDLSSIKNLTKLDHLSLDDNNNLESLDPIKDLIKLEELSFSLTKVNSLKPLENLKNLKTLRFIRLNQYGPENIDLTPLTNLTKLNYFDASHANISDVTALKGKTFEALNIDNNKIKDFSVIKDELEKFKKDNNYQENQMVDKLKVQWIYHELKNINDKVDLTLKDENGTVEQITNDNLKKNEDGTYSLKTLKTTEFNVGKYWNVKIYARELVRKEKIAQVNKVYDDIVKNIENDNSLVQEEKDKLKKDLERYSKGTRDRILQKIKDEGNEDEIIKVADGFNVAVYRPEMIEKNKEKTKAKSEIDKKAEEITNAINSDESLTDEEKDELKKKVDEKCKEIKNSISNKGTKDEVTSEKENGLKALDEIKIEEKDKKKTKAKEKIENLKNLSKDEKDNYNSQIDSSTKNSNIDTVIEDAKKKDSEKLDAKKQSVNDKIDKEFTSLKEEEKTSLKEEVKNATTIKDLDTILEKAQALNEGNLEKYKESVKKQIEELKNLSKEEKDKLTNSLTPLDSKEKVDEVLEKAKEKDKENLNFEKTKAKEEIDKLDNLSNEEKKDFGSKIDNATNKNEIDKVVEDAKAKNEENKKAKEKIDLDAKKENAKKEVDKLDNLSNEEKKDFKTKIDNATKKAEIDKVIEDAKEKDKENKKEKEDLDAKKEKAKKEIDKKVKEKIKEIKNSTLSKEEKEKLISKILQKQKELEEEIEKENKKEKIQEILEKAKEKIENINVKKGKKEKLPKTSISTIGVSLTALSLLGSIVSKKKKR